LGRIKCKVTSCEYYGNGDICTADEIIVKNNYDADATMEIGELGRSVNATRSSETACDTFKPRS